ncbi:hypothetical protein [Paraburkholderia sp. GAS32]|uniref:hypothetical protein n=1 Tax=Paraburkholderia sp. GAS32 TaxID=3035129 RepID=UPI003D1C316F
MQKDASGYGDGIAYVRVQEGLHGATMTDAGLRLPYTREGQFGDARNTSHWSVNSVVADHAYGRFNENADGSLKGNIVVIGDPREMPVPAGLGQVDTWFRMDATQRADGSLDRGLTVGHGAVVVAPSGFNVPDGINVVRYDGGLAERNAAVEGVLRDRNIEPHQAGMRGWTDGQNHDAWAENVTRTLYPGQEKDIHTGSHGGSVDESLESNSNRIAALVDKYRTERLHAMGDGSEVPLDSVIREAITEQRSKLNELTASLPGQESDRIGAFYAAQSDALTAQEAKVSGMSLKWEASLRELDGPATALPPPLPGMDKSASIIGTALPPPLPKEIAGATVQQQAKGQDHQQQMDRLKAIGSNALQQAGRSKDGAEKAAHAVEKQRGMAEGGNADRTRERVKTGNQFAL